MLKTTASRILRSILASLCLLTMGSEAEELCGKVRFPPAHPYLSFDKAFVEAMQEKAARFAWAKQMYDGLAKGPEALLTRDVPLPPKGDDRHWTVARDLKDLGAGYALSGDRRFAEKAREVLLKYADAYNSYPLTNFRCRAFSGSSLQEAIWLQPVILGYDLVMESGVFSEAERQHVEQDLLRSAVKQLKIDDYATDPRTGDLHYRCYNFQAWHLGAVGLAGLCLKDKELLHYALDGPYGFQHLVSHDLRDDGLFWERSVGYHHFVIQALTPFMEAALTCGLDLYHLSVPDDITKDEDCNYVVDGNNGPKTFKFLFDAPFYLAFPDLSWAVVGDSGRGPMMGGFYKLAYARYRDKKYAWLINQERQEPLKVGAVGFLHYYRYRYRYENIRLNGAKPEWVTVDTTYQVHGDGFAAEDEGHNQGDRYLLTAGGHRDFALEWEMTRLLDSGPSDRAFVTWHLDARDPRTRRSFPLVGACAEIGRKYRFRLEVTGERARLLRNDEEIGSNPIVNTRGERGLDDLFCPQPEPNEGEFALADGRFANTGIVQHGSTLLPSSGFAVLRDPVAPMRRESIAVNLNAGPYGGGHGHPDKLSIVLYASGHHWLTDVGSADYDSALKGAWTSQTVSHNTVVVDETSQYPAGPFSPNFPVDTPAKRAVARLTTFHADELMAMAKGECETVHPGVRLSRMVVNLSDYVVDVFDVEADKERLLDYVLHVDAGPESAVQLVNPASLEYPPLTLQPREDELGKQYGYQYLTKLQAGMCNDAWQAVWRKDKESLRLFMLPSAGTQIITGECPTTEEKKLMPFLLARRRAKTSRFLAVMEHTKEAGRITSIRGVGTGVKIESAQGVDTVIAPFGRTGTDVAQEGILRHFEGELAVVRRRNGGTRASVVSCKALRFAVLDLKMNPAMSFHLSQEKSRWRLSVGRDSSGRMLLLTGAKDRAVNKPRVLKIVEGTTIPVATRREQSALAFTVGSGDELILAHLRRQTGLE